MLNSIGFNHLEFAFLQAQWERYMKNTVTLLDLLNQPGWVFGKPGGIINVAVNIAEEAI
jgi:hypothetical protein